MPPLNVGFGYNELLAVSVVSARDVLAVGDYLQTYNEPRTLIERWNGSAWSVQPSPSLGSSQLFGVTATSSRNAWAVGEDSAGGLIEQWNGTTWKVQASPRLHSGQLLSVAATSSRNAWAVGSDRSGAVIEHWNGRAWKVQFRSSSVQLARVAATSSRNAWAVGSDSSGAVIEHWNGRTWRVQIRLHVPQPYGVFLSGVAATSPTNAWAVGATTFPITPDSNVQNVSGACWIAVGSVGSR